MAFPESLFPHSPLHSTRLRPLRALEAQVMADEAPAGAAAETINPWGIIWGVGGACWFIVTCTALLWMLPASGTQTGGTYIVSTAARATQHLMVFLVAALGYRAAIALGWPRGRAAQARVVLVNCLMALAVMTFAPYALVLAAGFIDGRLPEMRASFEVWSHSPSWEYWTMPLRFFLPPYILGLCAIALAVVTRRQHREALRAAELASACAAARMAMLSAQLQPHFLFNSLHAISVLIDDSPRQASAMIARLGDFLRHALESSHWPWVDVATELAGLEAYLAVQQMRFSDGLRIAIDASPESLGACVPALLLQPLAENAIEHGRDDSGSILHVRVATSVIAERLCIVVNNSSPQLSTDLPPERYGHGLANVELRLRAAYGGDATLTVGPDPHGGTSAFLDLPLRDFATVRPQRQ
jgi:hypothetical protein